MDKYKSIIIKIKNTSRGVALDILEDILGLRYLSWLTSMSLHKATLQPKYHKKDVFITKQNVTKTIKKKKETKK